MNLKIDLLIKLAFVQITVVLCEESDVDEEVGYKKIHFAPVNQHRNAPVEKYHNAPSASVQVYNAPEPEDQYHSAQVDTISLPPDHFSKDVEDYHVEDTVPVLRDDPNIENDEEIKSLLEEKYKFRNDEISTRYKIANDERDYPGKILSWSALGQLTKLNLVTYVERTILNVIIMLIYSVIENDCKNHSYLWPLVQGLADFLIMHDSSF